MTPRLTTHYAKNYCNRTLIVKVIVENVVTCFLWDTVYMYKICFKKRKSYLEIKRAENSAKIATPAGEY